jgi:ssDNA thymidine ADP-ribosyltransferase, DarT
VIHGISRKHSFESTTSKNYPDLPHDALRSAPIDSRQGAILSLSERRRRGIAEPANKHYWGAAGRKEEFSSYVCCGFLPPWGMLKQHGEEFAILALEAEAICTQNGTLFCPTNSAKLDYTVEEILGRSEIDAFDACFVNRETRQVYPQAEILVPRVVPLFHVHGIVFCDQEAHDHWMPKLRAVHIPDNVRSQMRRLTISVHQSDDFRFPNNYAVQKRLRE